MKVARSWTFTVEGQPVPKGRPRTVTREGTSHTYTPKRTKEYERVVMMRALEAGVRCAPAGRPVGLGVWVYVKRDGDLDNFQKCVLDSLNGIAYADDRQVVMLMGVKRQNREHPRLVVRIRWLTTRCP